jgi:hypothetical protein
MPGILRSPFILAFRDFDNQLRAVQISNIALVGLTTSLYAYILSWAVPRKRHWLAIAFAFAVTLLNPEWVANIFALLADAPYAFFATLCAIIIARVIVSPTPITTHRLAISAALFCFVIAFLTRYSALALLPFGAVLLAGRRRTHAISPRATVAIVIATTAVAAILVALNWETISHRYLFEASLYLTRGNKLSMMTNLFALALPSQIFVDLHLALREFPIVDTYHVHFGSTPRDILVVTLGLFLSVVTVWGMWRSRKRFAPEIAYLLVALPLLTLMIPSTSRYLMPYQPFLWIFFYTGATTLTAPLGVRLASWRRQVFIGLAFLVFGGAAITAHFRMQKVRTGGNRVAGISFGATRPYAADISSTFLSLRRFLDTLPRQRALLIGTGGTGGRWTVISGLNYYRPDSALRAVATTHDVYVVFECKDYESCRGFEKLDLQMRQSVNSFGPFRFEPVFFRANENAKAKVYRLHATGE